MLFLHETHEVWGKREEEFEQLYRDEWMPRFAEIGDARLLGFFRHAHGTGVSYRIITISAIDGADAWERLVSEVDTGRLKELCERLDELRHDVVAKVLITLPWSPLQQIDLNLVPTRATEHASTVFMEDTVWPHEGRLERYIEAAGSHYAVEMAERERDKQAIISIEGAFRTAFGSGRRREIILWQRVVKPKALGALVSTEVPKRFTQPGGWMHDALELRDQWESRLLRTASWSPLY